MFGKIRILQSISRRGEEGRVGMNENYANIKGSKRQPERIRKGSGQSDGTNHQIVRNRPW